MPASDRAAFIDKSARSFLRLLGRIASLERARPRSARTNPSLGLATTILLVLLISLSTNIHFLEIVGVYALVRLSLLRAEQIPGVLWTALAAGLVSFLVLLPSLLWGDFPAALVISAKVTLSVTMVKLLSATTEWDSLLGALGSFRVPGLFILVLDVAVRYVVLLAEMALALTTALKLRSVGRNRTKAGSLGGIAGTLFLRSRIMAESMHEAMQCRGFTGEYRLPRKRRASLASDSLTVATSVGIALAFAYLNGLFND